LENRRKIVKACELENDPLAALPSSSAENMNPMVKIHVDFLTEKHYFTYRTEMLAKHNRPGDYFFDTPAPWTNCRCYSKHDPSICKCCYPVYHVGQDESVFKQNSLPAYYWSVRGKSKLRPKSEGQSNMVSAVFDEFRGFGFPMTAAELELVNRTRAERDPTIEKLTSSPRLILLKIGSNREGLEIRTL
jgi:hypothetical protein